ncbi:hypothetical protein D6777_03300 [Candidatus Woesearchaeota archaeon]|nr:MAG: hypothetical protein D6777_03300 [Candidatus Woesearchaeota archaeon]
MLKVEHLLKTKKVSKDLDSAKFLLGNKNGGYLYLGTKVESRHQGFFFNDKFLMYKSIEDLRIDGKIIKAVNKFSSVIFERDNKAIEEYTFPFFYNSFIYEIKKYKGNLVVNLDCREFLDNDEWGRFYNIQIDKHQILITYEKQNDYWVYVAITGKNLKTEKIKEWFTREYSLDKSNNDENLRKIYSALRLQIDNDTKLVFTSGLNKEMVLKESQYVFRNINKLKRKQQNAMIVKDVVKNKERNIAYNAALNSLNMLLSTVDNNLGILSGFPNRYYFKSRDELISVKALGKRKEVSNIYERLLKQIKPDGYLHCQSPTQNTCAECLELFYKRFNKKTKINEALDSLINFRSHDGLATCNPHESWMDSLKRSGALIELQALRLNFYRVAGKRELEQELKQKVRELFLFKNYLKDSPQDETIRPNIFLAHYYYPDLVDDWLPCIKKVLPKLWCKWGGVSTLDKNNPSFHKEHTGIDSKSYHSGDSWYYLNNIAAMVMLNVSKKEFKDKINAIIDSSCHDILWSGILGHHSSQSSAGKQSSSGTLCSSASASTFIELINSL